jgi:hypothetical protein
MAIGREGFLWKLALHRFCGTVGKAVDEAARFNSVVARIRSFEIRGVILTKGDRSSENAFSVALRWLLQ